MRGLSGLLLATLMAGCVATVTPPPARGVVANGPPPAPVNENRPPPPAPQATWLPGYWHWNGVEYAWIPGHWEQPPPGATWSAPRYWTLQGNYMYEPGRWLRGPAALPPNNGVVTAPRPR